MKTIDEKYMLIALNEAKKALSFDEVPVGAIIVKDDKIIAKGHNLREKTKNPLDHAEIIAIKKASKKLGDWRLENCTIYVTIEPCSMCAGAILQSRISKIVYGAKDEKGGALGSSFNLFEQKNLNHKPVIISGVLEEECAEVLTSFFRKKRQLKK
ncbi:MAG: tRNA adenosine(34) deaminase TadA [Bacilli bacterium]|jgi:tRNA(adenine34) deaminase|nr:tRNA adenosine(34) deaminase TadA [Bacilli bacterium]